MINEEDEDSERLRGAPPGPVPKQGHQNEDENNPRKKDTGADDDDDDEGDEDAAA